MAIESEPFSARWRGYPYPAYRELRDRAPVHFAPESRCWCVSRYEDVLHILNHPEIFSSRAMFTVLMNAGFDGPPPLSWRMISFLVRFALHTRVSPLGFTTARNLIASDSPVHGTLRAIVNRGFTPRRIQAWEPRIQAIAHDRVARLARGEPFDVVRDLAIPLPVTIIAEMLGVERERLADFKRWSDTIISAMTGPLRAFPPHPETIEVFLELDTYLAGVIRRRRREPGDDLVSALLAEEPGGQKLSTMEIMQFVMLLLVAGNETTTNLIGNAASALLDHPAELARVAQDPSLVPELVEETLRYDAPVQIVFRTALRDVALREVSISKGATIAVMLGAANRDERRFPDPDHFDVGRDARGHLGFGFGQHFCLGASLARLEARIALEALVPQLRHARRASPERSVLDSFLVRGPSHLALSPAA
ncbi:MAG: cytochrome P450 [Myxococcales bacterium]|nr:MAG: cytochrome P450 [Myxococcales bacterium]